MFLSLPLEQAQAACSLISAPGDTAYLCESASSAGLSDLLGNNSLVFPAGGSGVVNGNITFGPGNDLIDMNSGRIVGSVTLGDGADRFQISAGTVTGAVSQGGGIDDFVMSGGQIQSLAQGDGHDTFLMSNGTIVGAFEDGDVAKQTGGTIGRVDMKLDNNIYDMSGGTILGNLVTGFGTDTINVSGGTIGGNISTSGGADRITVSGGVISGEVRASTGNDTLNWLNGGQIKSAILMGDGDDTSVLRGLSENLLASTPTIDGGLGSDKLTFDTSTSSTASRYIGWETLNLDKYSRLDLTGDLFLGDSISATGTLSIDTSSVLGVTQGSIRAYTAGSLVTLNNAGTIDMTTASSSAADSLTVHGNYIGNSGQLWLQSVLGDDSSASDKLVVSDGSINGNTQLAVTNLGGLGGLTINSGIEVVQALNSTLSSNDAFALQDSVSAGAYQYYLFKGGVTAGTENNWYLRSSVVAVQPPALPPDPPAPRVIIPVPPIAPVPPVTAPDEPVVEPPTSQPVASIEPPAATPSLVPASNSPISAASNPVLPEAIAGAEPIALYRLEVPVYSVIVPAAQLLTLEAIGTFHERQGEQAVPGESRAHAAGWARIYGSDLNKSWAGTVAPSFDGSLKGYQLGHDLYASQTGNGQVQRIGVFVGQSRLRGDTKGFAEGFQERKSGQVQLGGDHLGIYWTLTDPQGGYLDLVAMGTRLEGDNASRRDVKMNSRGQALALSAEAGYPITISEHWVVEPQIQLINQKIDMNSQNDGISKVSFDSQDYWTGRLGARLKGRYMVRNSSVEPYVQFNTWRTFSGSDTVTYNNLDPIKTSHKSSSADLGAGVVVNISPTVSLYMGADYSTSLDANALHGISGNVGLRVEW